MCAVAQ
jgi:hypothetical protein